MSHAFLPLFFAVFLSQLLLAIAWSRLQLPTDRSPWSSEVTRDPICFFELRWSPRIHHWGVWVAGSSTEVLPCSAADASALRESGKGIRDAKSIGCLGCCYCSESKGRCCCHLGLLLLQGETKECRCWYCSHSSKSVICGMEPLYHSWWQPHHQSLTRKCAGSDCVIPAPSFQYCTGEAAY